MLDHDNIIKTFLTVKSTLKKKVKPKKFENDIPIMRFSLD